MSLSKLASYWIDLDGSGTTFKNRILLPHKTGLPCMIFDFCDISDADSKLLGKHVCFIS